MVQFMSLILKAALLGCSIVFLCAAFLLAAGYVRTHQGGLLELFKNLMAFPLTVFAGGVGCFVVWWFLPVDLAIYHVAPSFSIFCATAALVCVASLLMTLAQFIKSGRNGPGIFFTKVFTQPNTG